MVENKYLRILIIVLMMMYVGLLTYVLVDNQVGYLTYQEYFNNSINFVPLQSIVSYIYMFVSGNETIKIIMINIVGSVLLFIPFGFVLPIINLELLKKHRIYKLMIIVLIIIALLQLIFKVGFLDIDNYLLYMLGVMIGYHMLISKKGYVI